LHCTNCGRSNPEGANFCSTCGAALRADDHSDTTVSFVIESEGEGDEEFSVPLDELEEGKAIIMVRKGPEAGTRFIIDKDSVTCGRHPSSDIFLDDVTVSRKHAEIKRADGEFSLQDLGSLNGTFVNRRRVEESPLSNGDEIQIGKFRLVFFTGTPPSV
jgi:hypothetical protein